MCIHLYTFVTFATTSLIFFGVGSMGTTRHLRLHRGETNVGHRCRRCRCNFRLGHHWRWFWLGLCTSMSFKSFVNGRCPWQVTVEHGTLSDSTKSNVKNVSYVMASKLPSASGSFAFSTNKPLSKASDTSAT